MKRLLKVLGVFAGLLILAAAGLWIGTRGDYPVAAKVTDDPALPAIDLLGIRLHAETYGPENGPVVIVLHGGPRRRLPLAAAARSPG